MDHFDIAILIPHHNNPDGLYDSLVSIKTKNRALIVVVDDGSDSSQKPNEAELNRITNDKGHTFYYIDLEQNIGIERALNTGLEKIVDAYITKYIARLDCGDISLPDRFDRQLAFMDSHQEIALCGTWAQVVDEQGIHLYTLKVPEAHPAIWRKMHIAIAFVHPTIMFRTEAIDKIGFYPLEYTTAEDYAYLFKFVQNLKTANIPEVLLLKERSSGSISTVKRKNQLITRIRIIRDFGNKNIFSAYGILRTILLLLIPYRVMEIIKENWLK